MSKKTKAKKKRVEKKQRDRSLPGSKIGRQEVGATATPLVAATTAPAIDPAARRNGESGSAIAIRPLAHRGLAQLCQFLREHSGSARISPPAAKNS